MRHTYFVSFSARQGAATITSWDTFVLDQPLEYGADVQTLIGLIRERFGVENVVIYGWQPLKTGQPPEERFADVPPTPPLRTADDYLGYKDNFRAEAAALFNEGLLLGAAWQAAEASQQRKAAAKGAPRYSRALQDYGMGMVSTLHERYRQVAEGRGGDASRRAALRALGELAEFVRYGLTDQAARQHLLSLDGAMRSAGMSPETFAHG